ncbi:polyhydroxyalkanoate depolymerase [Pusillimonas sp. NJUB218]|uniref:polyhydroxyalkanoate depolymerase n=1 Tax=Pusillimonas sp. NJUB218 TaxID=2023230 RepID=UPI000F4C1FAF|nr:polyhydroxyalkanoate depolymerase [Pusillimonas sp. NJUB218]ROT44627.1 polyhydroxyalkanoate depolymerase [Pusillimonas sp. NJUB218]
MLYDLHEFQRAFLNPLAAFTEHGSQLFSHPYSPLAYTPVSRQIAASYSLVHRLGKEYEKPAWGLHTTKINGRDVAVQDRVVLHKPFCNLVHFERDTLRPNDPVVLLVAPLSGHHATLLRDTVKALLPNHNIYVTDWVDARMVPLHEGPFHLNDYIAYIREFMTFLGAGLHVVSVCQPTVPVLAAVSLMATDNAPCLPKTMTLMGGPIDTRQSPTQVNELATNKSHGWFANNLVHRVPAKYPGFGRQVYPGFLQHAGFIAMNPDRHAQSHYDYYLDLIKGDNSDAEAHRRFYDEYNAVLDLPAEFYLDTIDVVFQRHLLPRGEWYVDGRRVDPAAIKNVALFTIEGELDDISGQGQTRAAQNLCSSIPKGHKQHYTAPGCGHYGIFSGRRWRETIAPQLADFIRIHG